ncbi:MAG TPA: nucleoside hydrolase [Stellaceae bacterium]|nr:nucleoside hydrolase [Stellaceae bacterium]
MRRKIVIDTDPGIDDAVAILLALASAEVEVIGVTAVAGNVPLAVAERNARSICELAGRADVPVHPGCARPMGRRLVTAEHVHGPSGLGSLVLPLPDRPAQAQHGVDFLVETLRREEAGSVTLCALGPLTTIAMALVKAPEIAVRVRQLVLMGGASRALGNITPAAEFNIYVDPHAADIVFASGIPLVVIPLDLTHQALSTPPRIARLRALGNRCGMAAAELLTPAAGEYSTRFPDGLPLHDPCVIAYLLAPELFEGSAVNVAIETVSELTMGMTVVDWRGVSGRAANAEVMHRIYADGFYALLAERLALLP